MSPIDDILYPAMESYHSDYFQGSALHQLYFEQYRQPQASRCCSCTAVRAAACELLSTPG
jgi:hypothetical protein